MFKSISCPKCGHPVSASSISCEGCGASLPGDIRQQFYSTTIIKGGSSIKSAEREGGKISHPVKIANSPRLRASAECEIKVSVISFEEKAEILIEPTSVHCRLSLHLNPNGGTNYKAGLVLAESLIDQYGFAKLLVLGDGEATDGGSFLSSPKESAIKAASAIKSKGTPIAAIGFAGPTYDPRFLRAIASNPALLETAHSGQVEESFVRATQTLTAKMEQNQGVMLVVYLIDSSGSMNELNKKTEVEQAFQKSIEVLKRISG